ncbi:HBR359Cp [Eremothecium sinecaudum]|uniref:Xylulose kinase n=1 Tax=Eremothecium sinecaudum TaxID=45286 RepID=A0A120K1D3_9SACH|nr:HBR359Cp [Eremothecium sinecaudum]AMD19260.1 HBR359Cp [Eremothecium sinecaudum]
MVGSDASGLFLGFDLSTQQLKCLIVDSALNIKSTVVVDYDRDLSEFGTSHGVYEQGEGVVEAPVAMWLRAVDVCFEKLAKIVDLRQVVAISGSCQQHGAVFWNEKAAVALERLDTGMGLEEQLSVCLSRPMATNWQDHSTGVQCGQFEQVCGGAECLAQLTGSRAHYRFTGPQIKKIHDLEPETYRNTRNISLVSSFLASIIVGKMTPLEEADACGMNLYDIEQRKYSPALLEMVGDMDLERKLGGSPLKSSSDPFLLGTVSPYFSKKYGLNQECEVYTFTGDNLATICSLPLKNNDVLVSMGTSTTVLLVTEHYRPSSNYHLFIHPTIPGHYMGMICYSNGSLARLQVCKSLGGAEDWEHFTSVLEDPTVDITNEIGVYFPVPEIVPSLQNPVTKRAIIHDNNDLAVVDSFADASHDVKNIVFSQALSCRVRMAQLLDGNESSRSIGTTTFDGQRYPLEVFNRRPNRVFFVGGASKNTLLVRSFADILGATEGNYRLKTPNSCALGGCYKAMWSHLYHNKQVSDGFASWLDRTFKWDIDTEFICDTNQNNWEMSSYKITALSRLESMLESTKR